MEEIFYNILRGNIPKLALCAFDIVIPRLHLSDYISQPANPKFAFTDFLSGEY